MKKLFIFLLLGLFAIGFRTPILGEGINTGKVPDFCVKVEFDGDLKIEHSGGWGISEKEEEFELHYDGSIVIKIYNYQYKDGDELNGFSWALTKGDAKVVSFTVKHGTTVAAYGNEFITSDRKEISNAVWCIELLPPINEEEPPIVKPPVVEPPVVEPPVVEPPVVEPPVEEPPVEEDPIEDTSTDEPLPETSDPGTWGLGLFGLGSAILLISKKKDA